MFRPEGWVHSERTFPIGSSCVAILLILLTNSAKRVSLIINRSNIAEDKPFSLASFMSMRFAIMILSRFSLIASAAKFKLFTFEIDEALAINLDAFLANTPIVSICLKVSTTTPYYLYALQKRDQNTQEHL